MEAEYEYLVKIIMAGDENSGKSSILSRYIDEKFNEEYSTTIGVEFGSKMITLSDGVKVKLQIWDTAG